MASTSINVTVNMRLDADKKTAETCLRVVEAYINANGIKLTQKRLDTGEMELSYEPD